MLYAAAAQVLRALAANPDAIGPSSAPDAPMRHVLRMAAEACEQVEQAHADRESALLYAAELQAVLAQASDLLEEQPLPLEGGTWDGYMLAQQARRLVHEEPLTAGHALRDELHSARMVARATTALVAARRDGDAARIRACEQALQEAVRSHKAAPNSAPVGPAPSRSNPAEA